MDIEVLRIFGFSEEEGGLGRFLKAIYTCLRKAGLQGLIARPKNAIAPLAYYRPLLRFLPNENLQFHSR